MGSSGEIREYSLHCIPNLQSRCAIIVRTEPRDRDVAYSAPATGQSRCANDDDSGSGGQPLSRRTFLGSAASLGSLPLSYSDKVAGSETQTGEEDDGDDIETHFQLGGTVEGWRGQSPSEIEDEENPTLNLQAGQRYRITWENADGAQHDFTILDTDGVEMISTELTSEQGETLSLAFTATEEMNGYVCTIHPDAMQGDLQIDGDSQAEGEVETHFKLGAVIGGWQRGPTNPVMELKAGKRYRVTWENLDGVPHDFTIQDADGNDLVTTEIVDTVGATRSLTFTASEEMDRYVCTIHPDTMVGGIEIRGGDQTDDEQPTGDVTGGDQSDGDEIEAHFKFGAAIAGWQGHSPFDGEPNSVLELEAGKQYRVTWENLDGVPHDFTIEDADGNDLVTTEITDTVGATRSLTFTAGKEMDRYVCTIHPESMRGGLRIDSGDIGDVLAPGFERSIAAVAAATVGLTAAIAYSLNSYFEERHEP